MTASATSHMHVSSCPDEATAVVEPGSELSLAAASDERPAVLAPLEDLRAQVRGETHQEAHGGRYVLGEVLGQGGMGEVWIAQDVRLERDVALKRLRRREDEAKVRSGPSDRAQLRFLREAQLTGLLEHPNIVPVYDLGVDESGALFFTMKRLGGRSLAEMIAAGESGSLLSRLDVFRKVCDAIAFAHSRAVIHRDLKPDNVMVGEFGEVTVLDWGLSKHFGEAQATDELELGEARGPRSSSGSSVRDCELTQAGAVIGTPAYMAPEQAFGKLDELDARTDVYALGALLYTLLTGERPFSGELAEVMVAVRSGRFDPPSHKVALPRELDAIVCTAMALEPAQRYPSVERLRADVQAFLEDRPIAALRYSWLRRLGKWAGRNRRLVTAVGLTGALGLVSSFAGGLTYVHDMRAEQARVVRALGATEDAREAAEVARTRAEAAEREAAVRAADALVSLARSLAQQDELIDALDKLDAANAGYEAAQADPIRATLMRAYIDGQNPAPLFRTVLPEGATVSAIAGDGRRLAWRVDQRVVIDDWVGGERVFDRELEGLADASLVERSIVASGEEFIAARVQGELLELLELESGEVVGAVSLAGVELVRLGGEGHTALVTRDDGRVQVWDTRAREALGPSFECGVVVFASLDSRRIMCTPRGVPDHVLKSHFSIWDTGTGRHIADVPGSPAVGLSPDGRFTAHNQEHEGIQVYSADSGELVWHLDQDELGGVPHFSPDSRRIFTRGDNGRFHWMNIEGEVRGSRRATGEIVAVDTHGDLVVVAAGREIQIWGMGPGAHEALLTAELIVYGFELSADEQLALAVSTEMGVWVHDPLTGAEVARLELDAAPSAATFDARGRIAAATRPSKDGQEVASVQLFELSRSTQPSSSLSLGPEPVMDLVFVRGDEEVLVGLRNGELVRWHLGENRVIARFDSGQCPWKLVASPDGQLVYVAGREPDKPEAEVWDVATGERVFASSPGAAYGLALAPSGDRFTTANHEGQPRTWSFGVTGPVVEYPAHVIAEMGVGYSPDGALLYSMSYDNKGRFWDTQTQAELIQLPDGLIEPVFTRDGRTLVGYGARFELELGLREAALELGFPAAPGQSVRQRTRQLLEALTLQHDWDTAARVLDWAEREGFEVPHILAGRIAWVRGDAEQAARHFRAALGSGEPEPPSLAIWLRAAERKLERPDAH